MTTLEKVDLLQNSEIFREVRTQSLARVAGIAQEILLEPRQRLFTENETPDSLYVLLEGEAAVARPGREERKLGGMQVAGALALLADQLQTETSVATQPVRALRIRQKDLFDAMAEDFNITRGVMRALASLAAETH